jgi:5'-nucleotidase (lipoprotein e(P4) family)
MPTKMTLGLLLTGLLVPGCATGRPEVGRDVTTPPAANLRDTHERLHGVLWMQTGAEYWSLAAGSYRSATAALAAALADRTWTAATEQTGAYADLAPAVILDLDETVLDNSPVQAQLVLDRTDYRPATWDAWVAKSDPGLIPGAKDFLAHASSRGVAVFFVTNRTAKEQPATLKSLADAGIAASDATVLCTGENGWTSDKTARRAEIARTHRVLLLIGDDLNDFVSTARRTPAERVQLAMAHADRWNRSWFLLPNPIYGSWERALYPGLNNDAEILAKKKEALRGFR